MALQNKPDLKCASLCAELNVVNVKNLHKCHVNHNKCNCLCILSLFIAVHLKYSFLWKFASCTIV